MDGQLTAGSVDALLEDLEWQARRHQVARLQLPPDPALPFPIFLEHGDRVVGWAALREQPTGLKVTSGRILDDLVEQRVRSGELKGLSIGGIVRQARCSICADDYIPCPHTSSENYDGQQCITQILDVDLCEVSIVSEPAYPDSLIRLIR